MCRHSFYMTSIYETTIIVKPDLANDQLKNLNSSIDLFFLKMMFPLVIKKIGVLKTLNHQLINIQKGYINLCVLMLLQIFQKN